MRILLTVLAVTLASAAFSACGGANAKKSASNAASSNGTDTTSAAKAPVITEAVQDYRKVDADRDNDITAPADDRQHRMLLSMGHRADIADRRAIESLIRRYYGAVVKTDGAAGCSMLYSTLADAVPEDYGQSPPGPAYARGKTCAEVMTKIYAHSHRQYADELRRMKFATVHLEEHHGFALLKFGPLPERVIYFKREGRQWKIESLLDKELP